MRNFNFIAPILILLSAFLGNSLGTLIGSVLGMSDEAASNLGFITMMVVAILVFIRLRKNKKNE